MARGVHHGRAMTNFASGSNRPADIRGFAAIGHAIGVAAHELSEAAIVELEALAGRGIPVFVDSGAFSEIEFGPAGPQVVRPIDAAGWDKRFALYRRLAFALGSQARLVAPDRIGDQEHTLHLLTQRASELASLAAMGAVILVPIQKGSKTQAEFYRAVREVLPFDFVPAIPSKKNATTLAELEAFVREIKPAAIHLLGMGPTNRKAKQALAAIEAGSPGCDVSLDANKIAANVGRSERQPRMLTRARDLATEMIRHGVRGFLSAQELGIILAFGTDVQIAQALGTSSALS